MSNNNERLIEKQVINIPENWKKYTQQELKYNDEAKLKEKPPSESNIVQAYAAYADMLNQNSKGGTRK